MKKCPYCAEEIQDEAIVCKHCGRDLKNPLSPPSEPKRLFADDKINTVNLLSKKTKNSSSEQKNQSIQFKLFGAFVLVVLSVWFWYVTIPGVAIWYVWTKSKFSRKASIIATATLIIVFAILEGTVAYANRAPNLTITDPQNNYSIQAQAVSIKGKVNPVKSGLLINNTPVAIDNNGNFNYQAQLPSEGNNQIIITASNGGKQVSSTLTVDRIFTDAEKVEQAKEEAAAAAQAKADAKAQAAQAKAEAAAQVAADAKAKAVEAAYKNSPAGRLCSKYPNWTADDCQKVANGQIWVGMTIDMVKAERGNPTSTNVSNYGSGKQYQWCWESQNYESPCFYGGEDGIITSYN